MCCVLQCLELGVNGDCFSVIDYLWLFIELCLWVFDLVYQCLLFEEWVVYGCNSGENCIEYFFNCDGSFMFSFGVFIVQEIYMGGNGYLLCLVGLELGFNDCVCECVIVIYGVLYVNLVIVQLQGWLGCSLGCLVVCLLVVKLLIDVLCGGMMVFVYYFDQDWLKYLQLLVGGCGGQGMLVMW